MRQQAIHHRYFRDAQVEGTVSERQLFETSVSIDSFCEVCYHDGSHVSLHIAVLFKKS